MQETAETSLETDFDAEIKNLYITLKQATETLLRHLLCKLESDRFELFNIIEEKYRMLYAEARQIKDETKRHIVLDKLEEFKRQSSALVVTLGGLVQQAEMPRKRFHKLLRTIKDL